MADSILASDREKFNPLVALRAVFELAKAGELDTGAIVVGCALIRHADMNGESFPSVNLLAVETRLSRRQVIYSLHALERTGIIRIMRRRGRVNVYEWCIPCTSAWGALVADPDSNSDRGVRLQTGSDPCTRCTGVVQVVHGGGAHAAPEGTHISDPLTTQEKGARKPRAAISFPTFIRKNTIDREALRAMRYFVRRYRQERDKPHPPLRPETWREVAESILVIEDEEFGRTFDVTHEEFRAMVRRYFSKKYEDCDYSLPHFNCDGVKLRLHQEILRGAHGRR